MIWFQMDFDPAKPGIFPTHRKLAATLATTVAIGLLLWLAFFAAVIAVIL